MNQPLRGYLTWRYVQMLEQKQQLLRLNPKQVQMLMEEEDRLPKR